MNNITTSTARELAMDEMDQAAGGAFPLAFCLAAGIWVGMKITGQL